MNAGGFRVSPLEVEGALAHHPDIDEIAVTDVEIRPNVRIIAAFYTAAAQVEESSLMAFAAERLARYKQATTLPPLAQPSARGEWQTFPARRAGAVQGRR